MYAVLDGTARSICAGMDVIPGETVHDQIPDTKGMLVARTKQMITLMLDQVVSTRGYDDIVSCISYVGDENPRFDAEARAARSWRSAVYTAGYEILANVPEGVSNPEQVMNLLPSIEQFGWPE